MRFSVLACLLVAGCGGGKAAVHPGPSSTAVSMIPLPQPYTKAVLSGPLCEADACTCRSPDAPGDGGAGAPTIEGQKRFELHVGPSPHPLWVLVDDMVLYKSGEHAEDCFYVDLQPGQHRVTLRASQDGGLSAAVDVHEYGTGTTSWYDTFHFECGSPGACSTDELDAWKQELARYTRNLFDPCGSTKVKQIAWDAGRAPDQLHPRDLQLELTLDVYGFDPDKPHGDPACRDRISD